MEADRCRANGYERLTPSLNLGNHGNKLFLWQLKVCVAVGVCVCVCVC